MRRRGGTSGRAQLERVLDGWLFFTGRIKSSFYASPLKIDSNVTVQQRLAGTGRGVL
jgi:hypothetical protein